MSREYITVDASQLTDLVQYSSKPDLCLRFSILATRLLI